MKGGALQWSVRRELWENRSIYLAPALVAAAMLLVSFAIAAANLPAILATAAALDPARSRAAMTQPYDGVAVLLIVTSVMVGWLYCLDALYAERRDRSILFWKSLPVSDLTTVAAKAIVPLVILPAVAFVVIVATQLVMLLASTAVLAANGMSVANLWANVPIIRNSGVLLYGLVVLALWYAPVYAYLLAISAAVPRSPFLWAVLPPVVVALIESIALGTAAMASFVQHRIGGSYNEAFAVAKVPAMRAGKGGGQWPIPVDPIPDPMKFLSSPGLWLGLVAAVALFALAIWLRRRREPI